MHCPPGTSTWNKIEHRLFSFISQNWRGRPLTDKATIIETSTATTTTGPTVHAVHDNNWYDNAITITDNELAALGIEPHHWHGEWNDTIQP